MADSINSAELQLALADWAEIRATAVEANTILDISGEGGNTAVAKVSRFSS